MKHVVVLWLMVYHFTNFSSAATDCSISSIKCHSPAESSLKVILCEHYQCKISLALNFSEAIKDLMVILMKYASKFLKFYFLFAGQVGFLSNRK